MPEHYDDTIKQEAAINYAVIGSYKKVADRLDIPVTTVQTWAKEWDGWDALIVEVRSQKAVEHRQAYSRLVDKALAKAEKGIDKLPDALSASDCKALLITAATSTDKLRLADNQPTRITGSGQTPEQIAEQFRQMILKDNVLIPKKNIIEGAHEEGPGGGNSDLEDNSYNPESPTADE
jgi:hypothetical protein